MITLPSGVTLRDFHAPIEARGEIMRRVRENMIKRFPMENDRVRIEIDGADYDKKKSHYSIEDYEHALLSGGRLATPLKGRVRLLDKNTGEQLDQKDVVLANVPYLTDDGTFIYGGNHYAVSNQSRLKSGVYARRKDNGELESHINTKAGTGPQMRLFMEPETGVYRVSIDKSNIKLYPVLKALGVNDEELKQKWGDQVLKTNQEAWDKRAFDKFYEKLLRSRARADATPEERVAEIGDVLQKAQLDPEVSQRTLGHPHANVGLPTLLDASAKLLKINRNEETADDRDHPANRTVHSVDDFLADRVAQDAGKLGRTLLFRATYDRSLRQLRPGYFSPQLEGLVVGNQLSSPIPGINPIEVYDQQRRVIQLGEGGIPSIDSVPMSARNVHPGQLGLIDPIRSSESKAVGIDQRFAIGAMKGSDNHIYFPLRNRKTKEIEYLNSTQLHGKIVAFPEAHSLAGFTTPMPLPPAGAPPLDLAKQGTEKIAPFQSEAQRRYLWANDPEVAKVWAEHTPKGTKLPYHKKDQEPDKTAADLFGVPKHGDINRLHEAKAHSDNHDYEAKTQVLRGMMNERPDDWEVDSEERGMSGVTHRPTGYRFHLPRGHVPSGVRQQKSAADCIFESFEPDECVKMAQAPATMIPALKGSRMTLVHPDEPDYELPSPAHQFTETTNLAPLVSTMKGARTFIASKYFVQALPLENPEVAMVDTLDDDTGKSYSRTMGHRVGVKRADEDGVVSKVDNRYIEYQDAAGKTKRSELKYFYPHNRKTYTSHTPLVKPGDVVKAGQPIARTNYVDNEGRLSLGKNLHVAFMPSPNGAGFEDAIVVSERGAQALRSQHLYGFDVEHKFGTESGKSKFTALFPNKYTNKQLEKIGSNGMIKPGVDVDPGDPIFLSYAPRSLSSKDAALGNLHKVLRNSFQDLSQTWEKATPGKVTHAFEGRSGFAVNVATTMPLGVGDKISGRAGAKGVVSRIIPNEQMYRTPDGDHVDVLINPAALIGRVNPAMAFEAWLGKIAHKTGKNYRLPSFTKEPVVDYVDNELRAHGIPPTDPLFDPSNGKTINNVLTGRQYFMKLEHTSDSKISGRGEEGVDQNDQPSKGGDTGAKRLGGLQALALVSHGATEVLRDAHLYRGSSNTEMWKRLRMGHALPAPKVPFIYDKFLNSLKAAGINIKEDGNKIHMFALTDDDTGKLAKHELQNSETIDVRTGEPVKGGLMDFSLHGGPEGRGWSYIQLDHPVPNPIMEDGVRRLLGLTEKGMRDVMSGTDGIHGATGPEALKTALSRVNLDSLEEDAKNTIRLGRKTKRDAAVKQLNIITGLKKAGIAPEQLMLSRVPVMPPTFRPISVMGNMMLTSDANYLYRDLMAARDAYRSNRGEIPDEDLGDQRLAIYDALKAVTGLGDPINVETQEKGVKGFVRSIAGVGGPKTGLFQSKVIGHPVNTVGRSVITPDTDLNMDEVGVPEEMAWRMFNPFVMRRMVRQGMLPVQAAKMLEEQHPFAKKFLLDEMEDRLVMYSRDPALHRFSIMGAKAVLKPGNSIRLSPLVVKPFGADFDGDQMNIHVPVSDEAIEEIRTKMLPSKNLFDLRARNVHYTPSQEFILGLFNSTRPDTTKQPVRFATNADALKAYRAGQIAIDQPVQIG